MGKNVTHFSVNSESKRYFNFFLTVLIVIGIFWCRDSGEVGEKAILVGKKRGGN